MKQLEKKIIWGFVSVICLPVFILFNLLYAYLVGTLLSKALYEMVTGKKYTGNKRPLFSSYTKLRKGIYGKILQ